MQQKTSRWICWLVAALALVGLGIEPAAAQLQYGDLYGVVHDTQGGPLPGVTVTLSGVGAPQVVVTDEAGQFRFLNLSPGVYQAKAELEGFTTVEYEELAISVGAKATLDITLSTGVTEAITVTGEEVPLLDERQQSRGANVSVQELDKVPTARDPWSLLSQAPGVQVDRINVGGNESGQQSGFLGLGSGGSENTFAVDGVILTDMNAVGASATYFDFGAFEEVQFTVASTDVTVATAGVTVNQVTRRGNNQWRGSARYLRTDGDLQSSPVIEGGNEIDSVEEYGADIGGYVIKDHLWWWGSYGESDIRNLVPAAGGAQQVDRTMLEDLNTKVNFQVGSNSGVLHYWTNDKVKIGRGAGPDTLPASTLDQTTPQDIYKVEDTHVFGSNFVLSALFARDDGLFTLSPQGGLDADIFTDANGIMGGSNFDFTQLAVIDQYRIDASYFFGAGSTNHELKFGGGFRSQENESITVWPRGKEVIACEASFCDSSVPEDVEFVRVWRNKSVAITSEYTSAWLQDTMTKDRWTITAGLRYDNQIVDNKPASDAGNSVAPDLLPPISFAGNDSGGFEWDTIVPRVGVTYALGEENKTLLRGSFSRYSQQLGQGPAQRVNPIGYSYALFYFTDANRNLVLDDAERGSMSFYYAYNFDPENPTQLVTPNVNDPDLGPAIYDELAFGVEHSLTPTFAIGATATYRNIHDVIEARSFVFDDALGGVRLATREDWVLDRTLTCPSEDCAALPNGGTGVADVFELRDGLSLTGGSLLTNGDREQDYLGFSLTMNKRLSNRWSLRGHATVQHWEWTIGDEFRRFNDPTNEIGTLNTFDDEDLYVEISGGNKANVVVSSNWSFNLAGLYQVAPDRPWGFNVGWSVTGRQGYPSPPFRRVSGGRRLQLRSDIDEFRNDDIVLFDARIDKEFQIGDVRLTASIDGFNLLNEDYVLQRERDLGLGSIDDAGRANQVTEYLSPRVFRVGLRIDWN